MGHWARVDGVGVGSHPTYKVQQVIVADASYINSLVESTPGRWIETKKGMTGGVLWTSTGTQASDQSGVGTMRYNYAGVGMVYDPEHDAFYNEKPYPSWVLNTSKFLWEPPIDKPTVNSGRLYWREEKYQAAVAAGTTTSVAWEAVRPIE